MMSDLYQISLRLLSSNELFFLPFRVPFQQGGCFSETDLHYQRIVVPPQSVAVEIHPRREYADGAAAKLDTVSCLAMDDHNPEIVRILKQFLQLGRTRFYAQPQFARMKIRQYSCHSAHMIGVRVRDCYRVQPMNAARPQIR